MNVDKQKFEEVVRALLNTPPLPLSEIPRKREPKVTQRRPAEEAQLI